MGRVVERNYGTAMAGHPKIFALSVEFGTGNLSRFKLKFNVINDSNTFFEINFFKNAFFKIFSNIFEEFEI